MSLITLSTNFSNSFGSLCCWSPFSYTINSGSLSLPAITSNIVLAILPEIVPFFIKFTNFDRFFALIGLLEISKFFSYNKANNSPVIQLVESFTSEFLITSSKYFDVSKSDTNIFAS